MSKARVALLGHGYLGKWHAQKISQNNNWSFDFIVDPYIAESSAMLKDLEEKYPQTKIVKSLDDIINSIDAAIVATPTSFHFELCKKLIEYGKNVFCEKPMTSNLSEAFEIKKVAENSSNKQLKFQVGHSERYHLIWEDKTVIDYFADTSSLIHFKRVAPSKGRASDVSVIEDLMIHDVDLMLFLTKGLPCTVSANGFKVHTSNYDHVRCIFTFEDGRECIIEASRSFYEEYRLVEISNVKGCLGIDLMNCSTKHFDGKSKKLHEQKYKKRDHLMQEQLDFSNAIINDEATKVTLDDGLVAMYLLDMISNSLEQRGDKKRIKLDYKGIPTP